MRAGWQTKNPKPVPQQQIAQMCMMAFGSNAYSQATPLTAGRSHQNLLLTLPSGIQMVLRIGRNKDNLQKQHALSQKLWRKLPVPRFISAPQCLNDQTYFAFLEFKRGTRLANLVQLPNADHAQLGFELGEYLALIHSQTFATAGKFNAQLKPVENYDMNPQGITMFFTEFLGKAAKNGFLTQTQSREFTTQFAHKILILNEWQHDHCLLHYDLNEDNILQHEGHISAILDWEFVMRGHPAFDFGKFTRMPYINCPIFLENLCDSYYLTHKSLPINWDDIAAVVDLISWAEFLSRPELPEDIKKSAIGKLTAILRG